MQLSKRKDMRRGGLTEILVATPTPPIDKHYRYAQPRYNELVSQSASSRSLEYINTRMSYLTVSLVAIA